MVMPWVLIMVIGQGGWGRGGWSPPVVDALLKDVPLTATASGANIWMTATAAAQLACSRVATARVTRSRCRCRTVGLLCRTPLRNAKQPTHFFGHETHWARLLPRCAPSWKGKEEEEGVEEAREKKKTRSTKEREKEGARGLAPKSLTGNVFAVRSSRFEGTLPFEQWEDAKEEGYLNSRIFRTIKQWYVVKMKYKKC